MAIVYTEEKTLVRGWALSESRAPRRRQGQAVSTFGFSTRERLDVCPRNVLLLNVF